MRGSPCRGCYEGSPLYIYKEKEMSFKRYPHLERFGNTPVENIEIGTTYVFPKLDGTNASVWFEPDPDCDGGIKAGSRNRILSLDNDNAGFYQSVINHENLNHFFRTHLTKHILYGEWLVPHTIKNYRDDAWRRFYIFDVYNRETEKFLSYDEYQPLLDAAGLDYIPCIQKIKNGSYDHFLHAAKSNSYLLPDGTAGEGVVIKNYEWVDKRDVTWAKIVLAEFKDEFHKVMGANLLENKTGAQQIADMACTKVLIEKEFAKIVNANGGWTSKNIPELLGKVYYCVVTEELWACLKDIKLSVNFSELKQQCILKVKELKPELF